MNKLTTCINRSMALQSRMHSLVEENSVSCDSEAALGLSDFLSLLRMNGIASTRKQVLINKDQPQGLWAYPTPCQESCWQQCMWCLGLGSLEIKLRKGFVCNQYIKDMLLEGPWKEAGEARKEKKKAKAHSVNPPEALEANYTTRQCWHLEIQETRGFSYTFIFLVSARERGV